MFCFSFSKLSRAERKNYLLSEALCVCLEAESLVGCSTPKARMKTRLPNGDYLTLAVWPGKSDPTAEVITVQVRRFSDGHWETVGRLAAYRTCGGSYSQLPERRQGKQDTEGPALEI